jgi:Ca-activated chloride channel family protein
MKAQSFEYQLRQTVPPAPDPEARLRAKRAALAEFRRVHLQEDVPGATARGGVRGFLGSLRFFRDDRGPAPAGWSLRNTVLSGVASACVAAIAVSMWWLIPPEERNVELNVPLRSEVQPIPESGQPAERRSEPEPTKGTASTVRGTEAARGTQSASDAEPATDAGPAPAPTDIPPVAAEGKTEARSATVPLPQSDPEKSTPPVARVEQPSPATQEPTAPPPAESSSSEPSGATTNFEEVIVTGARVRPGVMNSPSPIVVLQDRAAREAAAPESERNALDEVSVTDTKRSRLGRLFSRKVSASEAPAVVVPSEGRDKFEHFETNPVKQVSDDPVSTFSVDVDTASYSFVRRQLSQNMLPQVDAVRVEEMINYFDYAWPVAESREQPFRPTIAVSDSPWGEGKKLIHIGIKGYALPVRQQPDVNLVLLLDVSGSMNQPDKLPLAQASMALLLESLKPTDTVAIVVYAGAAGEVLAPTPVKEKETILQALSSLRAGGSTAGAAGIRLAYELAHKSFRKEGVNRILLATDGDFNVGITDRNELKGFVQREREKGVHLSVLGFGQGNYRDEMAQTLAQNGNGVAAYIDTLSEARKVLVQESTASLFTIARDVKLQVEFNPATVEEYRLVGYETRALNREDFNNDKVDAGDVGSGHTVTAIYEITPVGSKAKLIDEPRYAQAERTAAARRGKADEYGFLKIRYKLPNGVRSRLLQQPILVDADVPAALRRDVDFSTAVAGFGQLLRGGQYTGALSFEDVIQRAQGAIGEDTYGYRTEFVQLVRKAQEARSR